jgi:hypothetical protein
VNKADLEYQSSAVSLARQLDGHEIEASSGGRYRLAVAELRPIKPRAGWHHVVIAVEKPNHERSNTPLMTGIISGGGRGVMPWIEARLYPVVEFLDGSRLDARVEGLEAGLISEIGKLIPPGGHLMIEYESPGQNETHTELLLRVPPAATYLGSLMFRSGFRGAFKDWYISEGGHEGPRKLQANKSPSPESARRAMHENIEELRAFVKRPLPLDTEAAAIVAKAQGRAKALLREFAGTSRKKPPR